MAFRRGDPLGNCIMIRSIRDIVSDAAARFAAAGIPATCGYQRTINLGGDYTQAICSVAGYPQGFDAHATVGLSADQIRAALQGPDETAGRGWIGTMGGQQDSTWSGLITAVPRVQVGTAPTARPAATPTTQPATSAGSATSGNPNWLLWAALIAGGGILAWRAA